MKKMIFALVMLLTTAVSASAMSYEQARNEALFLTDKMAYELNLTDAQYEAAYEINLDYLMGVTSVDDVFGIYWERRNLDLSYILYSWQWDAFRAASYFYRPLYWEAGYWHFGIYVRYPRRDYFYFGRPHFYATYRGGHAWHLHGNLGYYHGHASHFRPALPQGRSHFGMRNGYDRGDYRGTRNYSSTRYTGRDHSTYGRSQGGNRSYDRSNSYNRNNSNSYNRGNSSSYDRSNNSGSSYQRSNSGNFSRNDRSGSSSSNYNRGGSYSGSYQRGGSSSGNFSRGGSSAGSHSGGATRSAGSSSSSHGGGHFGRAHR